MRTSPLFAFIVFPLLTLAEPLCLIAPVDGTIVPLLSAEQKSFLDLPREERMRRFADPDARETLRSHGWLPQRVSLQWKGRPENGASPLYTVEVRRLPDGLPVFRADTTHHNVTLENLEIARSYEWTVWERGAGVPTRSATATFQTEDHAPRLLHVHAIPNFRDIGGRIGLDGRRVRQGLVYRSSGFNLNASDEDPATGTRTPGATRIDDANRGYLLNTLGIRTDIDLRSDDECFGMTGSPLGPSVRWAHFETWAYQGYQDEWCRGQVAQILRIFLDPAAYPIDFHCISGADRTGSLAFLINALLGVEEEELWRDWETTGFWSTEPHFNHEERFLKLLGGFQSRPGATLREKAEDYVLSAGFTQDDLARLRELLLEPAPHRWPLHVFSLD